jgi:hypothetical protein
MEMHSFLNADFVLQNADIVLLHGVFQADILNIYLDSGGMNHETSVNAPAVRGRAAVRLRQ